jgi:hypothetical protein
VTGVDAFLTSASQQLGKPYVFGDEGPGSFDCSGLVQFAAAAAGITLPRTADEQYHATTRVSTPAPGDLAFWLDERGWAYHVGIVLGDGRMIAAPEPGSNVQIQDVWGSPVYGRIPGIGTAADRVLGVVSGVGSTVGDWLGGARHLVVEIAFAGAGIALVVIGAWKLTGGQMRAKMSTLANEVVG